MTTLRETTEQLRAKEILEQHLNTFAASVGRARSLAGRQIRELAVLFPWLADLIPEDLWNAVYRVQATGTVVPALKTVP
jgi:hypothetical protein